jgi:protein-tyrosine phosphatase
VPGRKGTAVIDPYYGDHTDFAQAWADVDAAAQALVQRYSR